MFAAFGLLGLLTISAAAAASTERVTQLRELVATAKWQPLAKGIDELVVSKPDVADLHVYRLAQAAVRMRVLEQSDPAGSSAERVGTAAKAALVINGGFWWIKDDSSLAPNGLLIVDGKKRAPAKTCSVCAGVLYADKKGLHLEWAKAARSAKGIDAALQAGPMIVNPGGKLGIRKPGGPEAARSAICFAGDQVLVFAILNPLTLHETGQLLRAPVDEGGFGCERAINLDGGTSTQVYLDVPGRKSTIGTSRPVQNFVAFFLKR